MQTDQIVLLVCGLCVVGVGIANFFGSTSRFVIYANIVRELDAETRKKYQKSIFPPYLILGLCFAALAFILPNLQQTGVATIATAVMIPLLVAAIVWIFMCNKKYLGRFVVPKFKR